MIEKRPNLIMQIHQSYTFREGIFHLPFLTLNNLSLSPVYIAAHCTECGYWTHTIKIHNKKLTIKNHSTIKNTSQSYQ